MTLKELKNQFNEELIASYSSSESDHLFHIFLEELANIRIGQFFLKENEKLEDKLLNELLKCLKQLKSGKPYQHILGYVPFANLRIDVNAHVLIPRPETEELAYLVKSKVENKEGMRLLDIGTGSGCLALALSSFYKKAQVCGYDVSEEALKQAIANAKTNNLTVDFALLNFLDQRSWTDDKWDVIVSNPPYIAEYEQDTMDGIVLNNEPWQALFVPDNDALIFYIKIAEYAQTHLKNGAKVFVEINERLGQETLEVFTARGFKAELLKDMSGKDRFVEAWND